MFVFFLLSGWTTCPCVYSVHSRSFYAQMYVSHVCNISMETHVWSHAALSCFPRVALLFTWSCSYQSLGLPLYTIVVLSSAYLYLQPLKMWSRDWFIFALLMNVPPFFALDHRLLFKSKKSARLRPSETATGALLIICLISPFVSFHVPLFIFIASTQSKSTGWDDSFT